MKHFVVFAAHAHPTVWLINAETLLIALSNFIKECYGPNLTCQDGKWIVPNGYGGKNVYVHLIQYLENEVKSEYTWHISEITDDHWNAPIAEALVAENPWEVKDHIERASTARRQTQLGRKQHAFIWYLQDGPLVTFYERNRKRSEHPIKITERFLLPRATWPQVIKWTGTYNDIAEQLSVEPIPVL